LGTTKDARHLKDNNVCSNTQSVGRNCKWSATRNGQPGQRGVETFIKSVQEGIKGYDYIYGTDAANGIIC
jgi:hypothetical protein